MFYGGGIRIENTVANDWLYSIDGGSNWSIAPLFTEVQPGSYDVLVANTNLFCPSILVNDLEVTGPDLPSIAAYNLQAADDCEGTNGAIALFANGSENQVYSIDNGLTWETDGIFDELPAGAYTLLLRDSLTGCEVVYPDTFFITGISPLLIDSFTLLTPPCAGEGKGVALPVFVGGSADYQYQWSDGSVADSLIMSEPGSYELQLTDSRGCADTLTAVWPEYPVLEDLGIYLSDTTLCAGSVFTLNADLPPVADFYWTKEDTFYSDETELITETIGRYTLNVLTLEGCLLQDSLTLDWIEGEYEADFLLPAAGVVGEPVMAIDISWPVPEAISWVYDAELINWVATIDNQEILSFPEPGIYTIGLVTDLGECSAYLEKDIQIYTTRDSLIQLEPQNGFDPITNFVVYPNPNAGPFRLQLSLTETAAADFWIFDEQAALLFQESHHGANYYELPFTGDRFAPGVYTAIARVGESWRYLSFVVVR